MGLTTQYIVPELSMNEVAMAGALRKGQLPYGLEHRVVVHEGLVSCLAAG